MPDRPTSSPQASAAAPARPSDADAQTRVLLAMLHGARSRGDRAEAERLWLRILVAELERVRGLVRGWRHSALDGGRIPAEDVDDVAHEVFIRLHAKVDTLKGRSIGELRNFMRTATEFTCRDYLDRHVRDGMRRAGSIDGRAPGAPPTATDDALARLAEQMASDDEDAIIAREIVHPALALVDPDKRAVLVMDQAGYATPEIMERLGIGRDAVYQRRRRGNLQLDDAIRELAGEDGA